ncbi:MAG: SUMF1/EgtB/PvdO family nonheme iron enzyme [Verrucomicrobiota bacterium]
MTRYFIVLVMLLAVLCGSGPAGFAEQDGPVLTFKLKQSELRFREISPRRYKVHARDFYLMETEVSNRMFKEYLDDTGRKKNDDAVIAYLKRWGVVGSTLAPVRRLEDPGVAWKGNRIPAGREQKPVVLITPDSSLGFCKWLTSKFPKAGSFRLPTVNEWVLAAYGSGRPYPWGDTMDETAFNHGKSGEVGDDRPAALEDVIGRLAGRTPEGLYHVWGNANEFLIHDLQLINRMSPEGGYAWGGGSIIRNPADFRPGMIYFGGAHSKNIRSDEIGFRVLLDPSDKDHLFQHVPKRYNVVPE